ncbi:MULTISPECIES: bifunctional 1-(5-phosphoribosyl)-5-((5-phosphoribosylamino)methylideneamino)imidazole-4-carboxamide isomerase/phosphoribosylanthranilate isomerase PriA [Corynebacterium]|uniref:1-(5-phosphoribosyl)-5-[(5-phosphoribosylamino)methylideneamino] imidazole-4-carboxamide isomerase n=1 Tax=Corynebacterium auriscanis TaxID=99807 RepID=A0A0A2DJ06_9CORY|nr:MULTISPECIES: bifunctional 1-(5-phosphoribosyl)-5-((5-phosphoribosylamino)methylideneamino)imidazole-4-carboxamide isomerase/phosphoribosylanthranilate isomerase PriA [Corynebacterium]KGM19168.1 phosphoribosyl isomerase [Corynebacterium auriscanis]OFT88397.1 bifunctional 1-(5-phosphoribosyl)-5-((5-phosphoribosylamino)methylideneamino)imidazole-4-carboxamide isomerase/phosphoribosylanthranilate isomerase PriA [Corynebacterium sp. HMSC28B08]WJY72518.1 Phosphoribosyl isomerase A [Corynebacterium
MSQNANTKLTLLPAVDVAEGQAVRLTQGAAGTETSYGSPLEAALEWQNAGADWIHLVDLDAAFGRGSNFDILNEVTGALDIDVELSGGIRDDESLERALSTGCRRVNIGTAALENPQWCEEIIQKYGDRVAIGLDTREIDGEWRLRGRGWTSDGGDLWEVLERLDSQGVSRVVVTDVSRDGMLNGPNIDLLRDVSAATQAPVVASGGISSLDDLRALRQIVAEGVDSAIVGKALYAGKFTLAEALEVAGQ